MRVLIAPDDFTGTLSAAEAGAQVVIVDENMRAGGSGLFQLGADPQLRSTDMQPVGDAPGRCLLYRAPGVPACGDGCLSPAPPHAPP